MPRTLVSFEADERQLPTTGGGDADAKVERWCFAIDRALKEHGAINGDTWAESP